MIPGIDHHHCWIAVQVVERRWLLIITGSLTYQLWVKILNYLEMVVLP